MYDFLDVRNKIYVLSHMQHRAILSILLACGYIGRESGRIDVLTNETYDRVPSDRYLFSDSYPITICTQTKTFEHIIQQYNSDIIQILTY